MPTNFHAVRMALSPARTSTYLHALQDRPPLLERALDLYVWNARLGATLLTAIAVCEVVIRNAVDDALTAMHGPNWPWRNGFFYSLPGKGQSSLLEARDGQASTGKVIAELSFGFWENMFVASFDAALWLPHLATVLPNLPPALTVQHARGLVRQEIKKLRLLRNRIAHHEPLLSVNAQQVLDDIEKLIGYRCLDTAAWTIREIDLTALKNSRPQ